MQQKNREPKHFLYVGLTILFAIAAIYSFYKLKFETQWEWAIPISLAIVGLIFSFLANKK